MGWCGRSKSLRGVGMCCFWWTQDFKWPKSWDIIRLKYVIDKLTYSIYFFLLRYFDQPVFKRKLQLEFETGLTFWNMWFKKNKNLGPNLSTYGWNTQYVSLPTTYLSLMISHILSHLRSCVHQKQYIPTPLSDLLRPHHPIRN